MKVLKSIVFIATLFFFYNINAQEVYTSKHDKTIDKLLPKAKRNKLNEKKLVVFTQAYHQANQEDFQRIMKLKESGQPDIWMEIYFRSKNIETRQKKIVPLSENIKTFMNFKLLNLDDEIITSKEKSELYIYAKTNLLLKDINEANLNEARSLINQLYRINPKSGNLEELDVRLIISQMDNIIFRVATPKELYLPENFAQLALDFEDTTIYDVPFDIAPDDNRDYDLMIRIMIEEKRISPERIDAVTFEEKNGDKVATITDKTMSKSAGVVGKIEFIDINNRRVLVSTPFDIVSTFVHKYAEIAGEKEACSEQTLQLSQTQAVDFPSDEALLKDVARKLNGALKTRYQKK